jgi:hypothetical protein
MLEDDEGAMVEEEAQGQDKNVLGDHSSVSSDNDSRSNIAQYPTSPLISQKVFITSFGKSMPA